MWKSMHINVLKTFHMKKIKEMNKNFFKKLNEEHKEKTTIIRSLIPFIILKNLY
jgi:hypothetical protein